MSKNRDYFTQTGITKKDRKEMAGCLSLIWPILLLMMLFF